MSDTDDDLDRLSSLLGAIPVESEGMTVGELDACKAALIVSPAVVMPSEWLPVVRGSDGVFADVVEAESLVAAEIEYYHRMARERVEESDTYALVLEVDGNGGELLWGPWVNGFERGMRLRAGAREAISDSEDEEAVASVSMILAMNALDCGESPFDEAAEDELDDLAPELFPELVHKLNNWTKSRAPELSTVANAVEAYGFPRVDVWPFAREEGQSEPCPCGSGHDRTKQFPPCFTR